MPAETDNPKNQPIIIGVSAVLSLCFISTFWKDTNFSLVVDIARFFSNEANTLFLVVGYLALLLTAIVTRRWDEIRIVLGTCLIVTLCVHMLKALSWADLPRPIGHTGGFPSGHSAAAFALAFLLSRITPRWSILWYLIAISISWSRGIVNAHYPYQIMVGSALGFLLAFLVCGCHIDERLAKFTYRAQPVLIGIVPCISLICTSHEYENDLIAFGIGGITLAAAILLRVWSRLHPFISTEDTTIFRAKDPYMLIRQPILVANAMICIALTIMSEVIWLVPLTMVACMVVIGIAAREDEKELLSLYGCQYQRYTLEVPRWIPTPKRLGKVRLHSWSIAPALKLEFPTCLIAILPFIKDMLVHLA